MQLGFDYLVRRRHRKFHPFGERLLFLLAQENHQAANLFGSEHTLPRNHAKLGLPLGDRPRDVLIGCAMFPLAINQRSTLPTFKRGTMTCGAMHPVHLLGLDLVCPCHTANKKRNQNQYAHDENYPSSRADGNPRMCATAHFKTPIQARPTANAARPTCEGRRHSSR